MQADWEMEIGPGAPIIDAHWEGFADLTSHPERAASLPEAAELPSLADALLQLNAAASPVWTSKCDVWRVEEPLDTDELDAAPEAAIAMACYIDLLARDWKRWSSPEQTAQDCAALCTVLHSIHQRACRADFIIRSAIFSGSRDELGVTAYLAACGTTQQEAQATLSRALEALVTAVITAWTPAETPSKLQ